MHDTIVIDGELSLLIPESGECGIITKVREHDLPDYTGPVEVTPGSETIMLATVNKTVLENIKVNPIPSNYGLITWDGSVLTVS